MLDMDQGVILFGVADEGPPSQWWAVQVEWIAQGLADDILGAIVALKLG